MTRSELMIFDDNLREILRGFRGFLALEIQKDSPEYRHFLLLEEAEIRLYQARILIHKAISEYKENHESF